MSSTADTLDRDFASQRHVEAKVEESDDSEQLDERALSASSTLNSLGSPSSRRESQLSQAPPLVKRKSVPHWPKVAELVRNIEAEAEVRQLSTTSSLSSAPGSISSLGSLASNAKPKHPALAPTTSRSHAVFRPDPSNPYLNKNLSPFLSPTDRSKSLPVLLNTNSSDPDPNPEDQLNVPIIPMPTSTMPANTATTVNRIRAKSFPAAFVSSPLDTLDIELDDVTGNNQTLNHSEPTLLLVDLPLGASAAQFSQPPEKQVKKKSQPLFGFSSLINEYGPSFLRRKQHTLSDSVIETIAVPAVNVSVLTTTETISAPPDTVAPRNSDVLFIQEQPQQSPIANNSIIEPISIITVPTAATSVPAYVSSAIISSKLELPKTSEPEISINVLSQPLFSTFGYISDTLPSRVSKELSSLSSSPSPSSLSSSLLLPSRKESSPPRAYRPSPPRFDFSLLVEKHQSTTTTAWIPPLEPQLPSWDGIDMDDVNDISVDSNGLAEPRNESLLETVIEEEEDEDEDAKKIEYHGMEELQPESSSESMLKNGIASGNNRILDIVIEVSEENQPMANVESMDEKGIHSVTDAAKFAVISGITTTNSQSLQEKFSDYNLSSAVGNIVETAVLSVNTVASVTPAAPSSVVKDASNNIANPPTLDKPVRDQDGKSVLSVLPLQEDAKAFLAVGASVNLFENPDSGDTDVGSTISGSSIIVEAVTAKTAVITTAGFPTAVSVADKSSEVKADDGKRIFMAAEVTGVTSSSVSEITLSASLDSIAAVFEDTKPSVTTAKISIAKKSTDIVALPLPTSFVVDKDTTVAESVTTATTIEALEKTDGFFDAIKEGASIVKNINSEYVDHHYLPVNSTENVEMVNNSQVNEFAYQIDKSVGFHSVETVSEPLTAVAVETVESDRVIPLAVAVEKSNVTPAIPVVEINSAQVVQEIVVVDPPVASTLINKLVVDSAVTREIEEAAIDVTGADVDVVVNRMAVVRIFGQEEKVAEHDVKQIADEVIEMSDLVFEIEQFDSISTQTQEKIVSEASLPAFVIEDDVREIGNLSNTLATATDFPALTELSSVFNSNLSAAVNTTIPTLSSFQSHVIPTESKAVEVSQNHEAATTNEHKDTFLNQNLAEDDYEVVSLHDLEAMDKRYRRLSEILTQHVVGDSITENKKLSSSSASMPEEEKGLKQEVLRAENDVEVVSLNDLEVMDKRYRRLSQILTQQVVIGNGGGDGNLSATTGTDFLEETVPSVKSPAVEDILAASGLGQSLELKIAELATDLKLSDTLENGLEYKSPLTTASSMKSIFKRLFGAAVPPLVRNTSDENLNTMSSLGLAKGSKATPSLTSKQSSIITIFEEDEVVEEPMRSKRANYSNLRTSRNIFPSSDSENVALIESAPSQLSNGIENASDESDALFSRTSFVKTAFENIFGGSKYSSIESATIEDNSDDEKKSSKSYGYRKLSVVDENSVSDFSEVNNVESVAKNSEAILEQIYEPRSSASSVRSHRASFNWTNNHDSDSASLYSVELDPQFKWFDKGTVFNGESIGAELLKTDDSSPASAKPIRVMRSNRSIQQLRNVIKMIDGAIEDSGGIVSEIGSEFSGPTSSLRSIASLGSLRESAGSKLKIIGEEQEEEEEEEAQNELSILEISLTTIVQPPVNVIVGDPLIKNAAMLERTEINLQESDKENIPNANATISPTISFEPGSSNDDLSTSQMILFNTDNVIPEFEERNQASLLEIVNEEDFMSKSSECEPFIGISSIVDSKINAASVAENLNEGNIFSEPISSDMIAITNASLVNELEALIGNSGVVDGFSNEGSMTYNINEKLATENVQTPTTHL
ncbi:hypothetical protein HK100_010749, partial [Physocladia obscura]